MRRRRVFGIFTVPGRPWVLFSCVWAGGLVAVWIVSKIAGTSSQWTGVVFGIFITLAASLVVADWQGVASYLVERRMASRQPTGSWMGEEEPDPADTRRVIKAVAGIGAAFGALILLSAVVHLIRGS